MEPSLRTDSRVASGPLMEPPERALKSALDGVTGEHPHTVVIVFPGMNARCFATGYDMSSCHRRDVPSNDEHLASMDLLQRCGRHPGLDVARPEALASLV